MSTVEIIPTKLKFSSSYSVRIEPGGGAEGGVPSGDYLSDILLSVHFWTPLVELEGETMPEH